MSDFSGDQELLKEFLTEAGELLADVDNKLVELERRQDDPVKLVEERDSSHHTVVYRSNDEQRMRACP